MEVCIYCAETASVLFHGFLQLCIEAEPLVHSSAKPQCNIQNQTVAIITSIQLYFTSIYLTRNRIPPACFVLFSYSRLVFRTASTMHYSN